MYWQVIMAGLAALLSSPRSSRAVTTIFIFLLVGLPSSSILTRKDPLDRIMYLSAAPLVWLMKDAKRVPSFGTSWPTYLAQESSIKQVAVSRRRTKTNAFI